MKLPIFQIDAFTSRVFGGNPAAVVVMDEWLADDRLLAIAAENNLPETAFVIARPDVAPLRWFTPTIEMDLCGHATLATAHVLFTNRFPTQDRITFSSRSGNLAVTREGERLVLDFPSRPGNRIEITAALAGVLGKNAREAYRARDLLAIVDTEEEVRSFRPDFARIAALDELGLILSAPGKSVDFVSRFFAPRAGVLEDPVTGSAHCTLVPYWAGRLGKQKLTAKQLSARGGDLECELRGDRVLMAGHAVEYMQGVITV
jgi:predicted PhzF superfamily epimerase YddE/YHI9